MKCEMDTIQFESRREIEDIMVALAEYMKKHKLEDDDTVKELFDKLDYMHMVW